MSTLEEPRYEVISNDRIRGVRVGAKVTYGLVRSNLVTARPEIPRFGPIQTLRDTEDELLATYVLGHPYTDDSVLRPRVRFAIAQDRGVGLHRAADPARFDFTRSVYYIEVEWLQPGRHKVLCHVDPPPAWDDGKGPRTVELEQEVLEEEVDDLRMQVATALFASDDATQEALRAELCDPETSAAYLARTIELLEAMEREHPTIDPEAARRHAQRMKAMRETSARFDGLLEPLSKQHAERHPIQAIHGNAVDNVELKVFASVTKAELPEFDAGERPDAGLRWVTRYVARIVDWTDPSSVAYCGSYLGTGATKREALERALSSWEIASAYPEGPIELRLPNAIVDVLGRGAAARRSFHSSGRRLAMLQITAAEALQAVAATASILAFAISLSSIAPLAPAVGPLLWTYIVSGTASSVLNIVSRHQQGEAAWQDDAIDVLSIASCLLTVPAARALAPRGWKPGATVTIQHTPSLLNEGVVKYSILGGAVVDGLQGVLVSATEVAKLRTELEDTALEPQERLGRILAVLGNLAKDGTLFAIGAVDTASDLKRLDRAAQVRLDRLFDRSGQLDIPDPGKVRGHTNDGPHVTRARITPPRRRRHLFVPQLAPEARLKLGLGPDAPVPIEAQNMLLVDPASANAMIARHGDDALAVHVEFIRVWRRLADRSVSADLLRVYHRHTGPDGVRYFDRQPATPEGNLEIGCGLRAALLDDHYRTLFSHAGHSVECHGPHLTDERLLARLETGRAPDGRMSPTRRSSRFISFKEWILAHDSALAELGATFGLDARSGPVLVSTPKGVEPRPKVQGLLEPRRPENLLQTEKRPTGDVFEGLNDGSQSEITYTRADQSSATGMVYKNSILTRNVRAFQVTLGWTGKEWILIQCFPTAPSTDLRLDAYKIVDKTKTPKHSL